MKKKAAVSLIAALLLGAMLGAGASALWERSRPEPLFDLDPAYITEIYVDGTAARESGDGVRAVITDREDIERIAALLNGFTYDYSEVQTEAAMGWESRLYLNTGNGVSVIGFSTDKEHGHDVVTRGRSGDLTHYYTDPGYLWEIAEMCDER